MKKGTIFILLIIFLVFVCVSITQASLSFEKIFGGKITNTKATQIEELENSGYTCHMVGSSITVRPIGSPAMTPTEYFIPSSVKSKTITTIKYNQWILGKYSGKTTITCTRICPPAFCTTTVTLDTVTYFGTS